MTTLQSIGFGTVVGLFGYLMISIGEKLEMIRWELHQMNERAKLDHDKGP
jgi:hypothetical protein